MSRKILGLDIRKEAVTAVLLQSKIKGMSIEAHAYSPISEPNGIKQGVSDCISSLMKQADISGASCIAAYPSENIFYRNIRVPFKAPKKIKQILPYELEPTLPLPVEDLIIDFHIPGLSNQNSHSGLLAAAAETSELKSFMQTLAESKLVPTVLAAGGYSTAFHVARTKKIPDVCLFIDMGLKNCGLFVIISGWVCYARSFSLRTGSSDRATLICNHAKQTLAAVKEILQMEIIAGGVLITGCGVEDKSILGNIAQNLEIPVTAMDLARLSDVTVKNIAVNEWKPLRMDNALALALNDLESLPVLNFRKGPFAPRKLWVEHKKYFIQTGILAGVIASFAFMDIVIDNYFMGKKVDRLNAQTTQIFRSTFPDIQKIVDPVQQMRVEIQNTKKQTISTESPQKNVRNIDILYDISTLIPDDVDVELNRIVIGPGSVQISGYTDTFNSVNNFQRKLQGGKLFKTVTINSANIEKTENRVNFKLNLQL
ncbi:MAG: PilN domain-containing protein [Desulfobacterales bacterium]|nr:PilN domain-containing protein [Desulfobacterales bacterium]